MLKSFAELAGHTLAAVKREGDDAVLFELESGDRYKLQHQQDCCESVTIEDIAGDLGDLVGSPIVMAEESTGDTDPDGTTKADEYRESFTWTFYRIGTNKGTVVIRFYGESNGYYSESVDFVEC